MVPCISNVGPYKEFKYSHEYDLCMFASKEACDAFVKMFGLEMRRVRVKMESFKAGEFIYYDNYEFSNADRSLVLEASSNPYENECYLSFVMLCGQEKEQFKNFAHEFERHSESCK